MEVEMKEEGGRRWWRDGVGDGSKVLSLLTSFSLKGAESEGKGRNGVFIL